MGWRQTRAACRKRKCKGWRQKLLPPCQRKHKGWHQTQATISNCRREGRNHKWAGPVCVHSRDARQACTVGMPGTPAKLARTVSVQISVHIRRATHMYDRHAQRAHAQRVRNTQARLAQHDAKSYAMRVLQWVGKAGEKRLYP